MGRGAQLLEVPTESVAPGEACRPVVNASFICGSDQHMSQYNGAGSAILLVRRVTETARN